eukprot:CAMPEP_0114333740 /NCGR_PEP_ID=MMETSP0101-20121206/3941_1 /TAXON_ID=38822 ORGANISM="Pteridomonas danica, Strain PT" /NCGR_SAMPLE_ID=MMETSP0101 /ASSEMBLY_ACC=CAM_ASM_000211 /LENGTH=456 /DNA_ID=CAMNT_0001464829 /DNA_START=1515 /DNA_END=2885 /DNA_ORIENTATION=-
MKSLSHLDQKQHNTTTGNSDHETESDSSLWLLPSAILYSMRGSYFDDLIDPKPWFAGKIFLPPQSIKRAYQIDKHAKNNVTTTTTATTTTSHQFSGFQSLSHLLSMNTNNNQNKEEDVKISIGEDSNSSFPTSPIESMENPMSRLSTAHLTLNVPLKEYLNTMTLLRDFCFQQNLIPLYHYTSIEIVPLILNGGLRMSSQGQGDGGVYFSTLGPASYGLGTPDYETNLIIDCFGKERLEEYKGKHKLDVCLIYAVDPLIVEQAHGGRQNALVVSKGYFEVFSLPHADGNYFLTPDRLIGAFHYNQSSSLLLKGDNNNTDESLNNTIKKGLANEINLDIDIQYEIKKYRQDRKLIELMITAKLNELHMSNPISPSHVYSKTLNRKPKFTVWPSESTSCVNDVNDGDDDDDDDNINNIHNGNDNEIEDVVEINVVSSNVDDDDDDEVGIVDHHRDIGL